MTWRTKWHMYEMTGNLFHYFLTYVHNFKRITQSDTTSPTYCWQGRKSNVRVMNRNWSNQKVNPTRKTKMGQPKSQIDKIQWEQMANRVGIYFPPGDHSATQTELKKNKFIYGGYLFTVHDRFLFQRMNTKSCIFTKTWPFLVISLNFDYVQRVY